MEEKDDLSSWLQRTNQKEKKNIFQCAEGKAKRSPTIIINIRTNSIIQNNTVRRKIAYFRNTSIIEIRIGRYSNYNK